MQADETARAAESRYLATLEGLLALPPVGLKETLDLASNLITEALGADKIDALLYQPSKATLVALGTSETPMGRHQHAIGLDVQQLVQGGVSAQVFQTGTSYFTGHLERDPGELRGIVENMGVRSQMAIAIEVNGERRGVLSAQSATPEFFSDADFRFFEAVTHWVGIVLHRVELAEQLAERSREEERRGAAEQLITLLAHDLGNYLAPLRIWLQMLRLRATKDGRLDDVQQTESAEQIVGRLQRIIDDLLDVARLDAGLFELRLSAVDLVREASGVAHALGTPERPVEVQGPTALTVVADPARIRQVIENVVSNAVKHTPAGTSVLIELRLLEEAGASLALVDVTDRGPGVPAEVAPRIFDRFVSGEPSSGLGLGLYVARRIADKHGGKLELDGSWAQGARFRLTLPLDGPRPAPRRAAPSLS